MSLKGIKYQITARPWIYSGKGAWIFVTLPVKISKEIRRHFKAEEECWGRLKTTAQIGNSEWSAAICFDSKSGTYLLPLKAEIRKNKSIELNEAVTVAIWI